MRGPTASTRKEVAAAPSDPSGWYLVDSFLPHCRQQPPAFPLTMEPLPNAQVLPSRRRRGRRVDRTRRMSSLAALLLTTCSYCCVSSSAAASFIHQPCGHQLNNALRSPRAWNPASPPTFQSRRQRSFIGGGAHAAPAHLSSSSALYGVRSSLREQLSRIQRAVRRQQNSNSTSSIPISEDPTWSSRSVEAIDSIAAVQELSVPVVAASFSSSRADQSYVATQLNGDDLGPSSGTTAVLTAPPPQQLRVGGTERLYSLPPLPTDRRLTKLEVEFRDMLEHFTNYSESDLLSLRDPRMRTLFRGVAASAVEPPVYRAFEVLYEDLYPLRLAGRLVYKMLKELMVKSQHEREHDVAYVVNVTGLANDDVEATRLAFVSVAAELNGDAYLTRRQLERIDVLTDVAVNILNFESVDELLERLEQHSHAATTTATKDPKHHHHSHGGKLSFTDLIIGLQHCAEEMCGVEACNPAAVMHHIMLDLKNHPPMAVNAALDEKRRKFSDRYDEMLSQFMEWEDVMPDGEGRRMDVVKGCFVGARNQPVVDALRIVYVDYSPLRVAGDIIFKLVSGVMRARQQLHHHHHHHHDHPPR